MALDGPVSATAQAIARSAQHRQDRGVWTSSGAGGVSALPCFACIPPHSSCRLLQAFNLNVELQAQHMRFLSLHSCASDHQGLIILHKVFNGDGAKSYPLVGEFSARGPRVST